MATAEPAHGGAPRTASALGTMTRGGVASRRWTVHRGRVPLSRSFRRRRELAGGAAGIMPMGPRGGTAPCHIVIVDRWKQAPCLPSLKPPPTLLKQAPCLPSFRLPPVVVDTALHGRRRAGVTGVAIVDRLLQLTTVGNGAPKIQTAVPTLPQRREQASVLAVEARMRAEVPVPVLQVAVRIQALSQTLRVRAPRG